ncbi:response regulator [Echinicola shivajiensis]|uniref:response regulator n=1 Tax=Echinicola shivajiensis TaxID=1035916 RepID=UPI001BFCCCE2|nr:response regulator [Echinicola shivajiensis]
MLRILDHHIDKQNIERGKVSLENVGFDLKQLLQRTIGFMHPHAQEKGKLLNLAFIDHLISPVLIGDPYRINQVFCQLIYQGLFYSKTGRLEISCELKEENEITQIIQLKLTDIGNDNLKMALPSESLQKDADKSIGSFFKFYNLFTDDKLIPMLKGQLIYTLDKEWQEVVCLEISFKIGKPKDQLPSADADFDFIQDKKILLAEQNELNRIMIKGLFQEKGAEVQVCNNGLEVLKKLEESSVDFVLLSDDLSLLNGLETAKIIRQKRGLDISIIGVFSEMEMMRVEMLGKTGMNDYLIKPFDEYELFEKLKNSKIQSVESPEELLYDLEKLKTICNGNLGFMQNMITLFIQVSNSSIKEMREALMNRDLAEVQKVAHRLKPSLNSMGITRVKEDIVLLEEGELNQDEIVKILGRIEAVVEEANMELKKVKLI